RAGADLVELLRDLRERRLVHLVALLALGALALEGGRLGAQALDRRLRVLGAGLRLVEVEGRRGPRLEVLRELALGAGGGLAHAFELLGRAREAHLEVVQLLADRRAVDLDGARGDGALGGPRLEHGGRLAV